MTCDRKLTERLIEITAQPLQHYKQTFHFYDGLEGSFDSYSSYDCGWDISPRKRLVVTSSQNAIGSIKDHQITYISVQYRMLGFKYWTSYLNRSLFTASGLETIRQFALDGAKSHVEQHKATRDVVECELALQKLS